MKTRHNYPSGLTAKPLFTTLLFALALAPGTRAATNTVTITADSGAGTLRDTIAAAASGDTIVSAAGLSGQTITLTAGLVTLSSNVTIDASSLPAGIGVSGNNASRVFDIPAGLPVMMNGQTIRDGFADQGGDQDCWRRPARQHETTDRNLR